MDSMSIIRTHIECNVKSFYELSRKQKRELVAYELISNHSDGCDMIVNHDGQEITQLVFNWYVKRNISAKKALTTLLDDIIQRYSSNFDEMFDEECERYMAAEKENLFIYRSAQNGENSGCHDAHNYV